MGDEDREFEVRRTWARTFDTGENGRCEQALKESAASGRVAGKVRSQEIFCHLSRLAELLESHGDSMAALQVYQDFMRAGLHEWMEPGAAETIWQRYSWLNEKAEIEAEGAPQEGVVELIEMRRASAVLARVVQQGRALWQKGPMPRVHT